MSGDSSLTNDQIDEIMANAAPNEPSSGADPEKPAKSDPGQKGEPDAKQREAPASAAGASRELASLSADQIKALVAAERAASAAEGVGFVMGRGLVPTTGAGAWWVAMRASASGIAKNIETPEQYLAVISTGAELGLTPYQALRQIAPINGQLCLWGDAPKGLVLRSGLCAGIDESYENLPPEGTALEGWPDNAAAVCVARRLMPDGEIMESERAVFSVGDARRAGLWLNRNKAPWCNYPKRMLKYRARAFCLRDTFPDVLMGLLSAHEMDDFNEGATFSPNRMKAAAKTSMEDRRQEYQNHAAQADANGDDGGGREGVRVRPADR